MKNQFVLVVLLAGLGFSNSNAQSVPEALNKLFRFEGNWMAPTTMVLDGNTYNFNYYASFSKSAESSGMYMEESFSSPELGDLKGYNMIGFNSRDGKIHWFTVDNFGTTHEHLGYWITDDHFFMSVIEKHDGKKFEELIDMTFIDNDHVSFHLIAKLANTVFEEVSGTFERQPN